MWPFKKKSIETTAALPVSPVVTSECVADVYRTSKPSGDGYAYFLTADEAFSSSDRDWVGVVRMKAARIDGAYYWLASYSPIEITKGES